MAPDEQSPAEADGSGLNMAAHILYVTVNVLQSSSAHVQREAR